jgi:hypothetical protein
MNLTKLFLTMAFPQLTFHFMHPFHGIFCIAPNATAMLSAYALNPTESHTYTIETPALLNKKTEIGTHHVTQGITLYYALSSPSLSFSFNSLRQGAKNMSPLTTSRTVLLATIIHKRSTDREMIYLMC